MRSSSRATGKLNPYEKQLAKLNATAPPFGAIHYVGSVSFGAALQIHRFRLANGLTLLTCEDHSAPVVAYHTWYRVGSRHEQEGKTGLAHLFEHLMFNEIEGRKAGEFDRKLEEAGAESNASTWLDWTQYNIAIPKDQLGLVIGLEAERMSKLVLRDPQVTTEKGVVANERRYRVDDDVEGAVSELLWATAFTRHSYRWPTIGWMQDIEGFTTEDCDSFYRTYYAPNNAIIVAVGDVSTPFVLGKIAKAYGDLPSSALPVEDVVPEPPQTEERDVEVTKPTSTQKLAVGYHSPAMGDFDHPALSLLAEVLFGGRASRLHQKLVRELEIATEVRIFVGPFRDPGLVEIYASARGEHTAEELLAAIDEELTRAQSEPIASEEIERARARLELGLLAGLETVDGKASTIGFYETLLGRPAAAFERMEVTARLTASDLLRVARRYLRKEARSIVRVRAQMETEAEAAE
ncbi:MAG TPA: pitrilysin family protein [Polyangiaceae bacterium]